MEWKTLSSEYIIEDKWLRARKDVCETPDGKIVAPYFVLEYKHWVAGVALTKDGHVVLIRQYRHALGKVCTEIPGGCVDEADKNLEEAVRREVSEETGYSFDECEFLGSTSPNPSTNTNLMHMFLLKGGVKDQVQELDHSEEIEVVLVPLDELYSMVIDGKLDQAMHVTAVMLALHKMGKLHYTP